jgi:hypothetical protein
LEFINMARHGNHSGNGSVHGTVKNLDVQELGVAPEGSFKFAQDGTPEEEVPEILVESNLATFSDKAAQLAFNEEFLTIQLHGTTDPNAEPMVFLAVNGVGAGPNGIPWLPRDVAITIKRKYVERLCRARPIAYGNVEKTNEQGERYIDYPKTSALKYPFSVIEDKNPKGGKWLSDLLSSRA